MPEVTDEFRRNKSLLNFKRTLRAEGLHVPEVSEGEFFSGVRKRYPLDPDIPALQEKVMENVRRRDAKFLSNHPLFSEPLTKERIRELYGSRKDLIARDGSEERVFANVARAFQVRLKHIKHHMVDSPNPKELQHNIEQAENILRGQWED